MKRLLCILTGIVIAIAFFSTTAFAANYINYQGIGYDPSTGLITGYIVSEGGPNLVIPSQINGTTIRDFMGTPVCNTPGLVSVTFPSTFSRIQADAFYGDNDLTSLTIPSSVTDIGAEIISPVNVSKVTIYADDGSAAEAYANSHNIKFVNLDPPAPSSSSTPSQSSSSEASSSDTSISSTPSDSSSTSSSTVGAPTSSSDSSSSGTASTISDSSSSSVSQSGSDIVTGTESETADSATNLALNKTLEKDQPQSNGTTTLIIILGVGCIAVGVVTTFLMIKYKIFKKG